MSYSHLQFLVSRFKISDPTNNTEKDSEFLIPKEYNQGFRISDPQRTQRRIQNL